MPKTDHEVQAWPLAKSHNHDTFTTIKMIAVRTVVADLHELAQAFKALSNPNRLQMYLELLRQRQTVIDSGERRECSCGLSELMVKLNVGAPTVSHHVKELVNARLIRVERNGKFMTCYLNDDMRIRLEQFFNRQD